MAATRQPARAPTLRRIPGCWSRLGPSLCGGPRRRAQRFRQADGRSGPAWPLQRKLSAADPRAPARPMRRPGTPTRCRRPAESGPFTGIAQLYRDTVWANCHHGMSKARVRRSSVWRIVSCGIARAATRTAEPGRSETRFAAAAMRTRRRRKRAFSAGKDRATGVGLDMLNRPRVGLTLGDRGPIQALERRGPAYGRCRSCYRATEAHGAEVP
jgi:hypothetical protein